MARRLRWVIATYHWAARRASELWWCSASTSAVDDSAISSHRAINPTALPAAGTIITLHTRSGQAAWAGRLEGPCLE